MRDGKKMMSTVLGIKTIQNEAFNFSIDTTEKMIFLNNLSSQDLSPVDLSSFSTMLDHVLSIKKMKLGDGSICYKILFKENPSYSSFEIELTENGLLKKQRFFYASEVKEENDEEDEE